MKPAPFEYHVPNSRAEALALLSQLADEAKVLAGGQSLVPAMNFRLAQPSLLIDLNRVEDLAGIRPSDDGGLSIGAMTRQRAVERSDLVATRAPLLAEALPHIAHPQIRNRGTFGGSLAHADPAAELPALAVALQARLRAQSSDAARWIPADEFFLGVFTTALEPDELLVEVAIPALPRRTGCAFEEVARRHGDYALVGAAAVVSLAGDGAVADCRLVLFSVSDGPLLLQSAAEALIGRQPDDQALAEVSEIVAGEVDPATDIHASAAYRRHLARVLARRTLARAAQRAEAG